jgi:UDP-glucose 4-epimerase
VHPHLNIQNTAQEVNKIMNILLTGGTGFRATLLSYFNPVGAHESGLLGEGHVAAIEKLEAGVHTYNLGIGHGTSAL